MWRRLIYNAIFILIVENNVGFIFEHLKLSIFFPLVYLHKNKNILMVFFFIIIEV